VQLQDGAVDPGSQPEVIGIDDKTAHRVSLSIEAALPVQWSETSPSVAALV
jgi:hypothetical protein